MVMSAKGGRATSDHKIIGEYAWRLLNSFAFDPKELRGIGIQVQKLETADELSAKDLGQSTLAFKRTNGGDTSAVAGHGLLEESNMEVQPPSQGGDNVPTHEGVAMDVDLPAFSQVDHSVFDALPDDVRKELEDEYKRRSASPFPAANAASTSTKPMQTKPQSVARADLSRITRQLAPRSRASLSPRKNKLFKRAGPSAVTVSEDELRKLSIDPLVFAVLPLDLQREQLAGARFAQKFGVAELEGPRKVLKPIKRKIRNPYIPPPPPSAVFRAPPVLVQQGAAPGERLRFTEADDVQRVIEVWVGASTERPPNARDVEFFAKFLVQCVDSARSTDTGLERAVAVMKWWLVLLRRRWAVLEHVSENQESGADGQGRGASEVVGKAWWTAFREVKEKMDDVARRKFGGRLSIR